MNGLVTSKDVFTSLELVEQINMFRREFGEKNELRHDNLMSVIRDEFDEEISLLMIQESEYVNSRGRKYPMFELTAPQAKQVLVRESKAVRKAVIKYIEELETEVKRLHSYLIENPAERARAWALEYEAKLALEATVTEQSIVITEQAPLVQLAEKRLDVNGLVSITDVTKTFGLKRGALTALAKERGYLHKAHKEVNDLGEQFFRVYDNNGFRAIGVTKEGLRLVSDLIEDGSLTIKGA